MILKELERADRAEKNLAELRQHLKLDLPAGTERSILPELQNPLRTLNEYDPETFKAVLERLTLRLPRE